MPRTSRNRKKRNREVRCPLDSPATAIDEGAIAARNFALRFGERLDPYTVILAIMVGERPDARDVITNGTGSLVDTGKSKVLVTNYHVYADFLSRLSKNPQIKLTMSGAHGTLFLDISKAKCLGLSKEFDLAVLSVPPHLVLNKGKSFWPTETWPPPQAEKGMLALLVGYPGEGLKAEKSGALGASPLSAGMRVVSVNERHFVIADEAQDAHTFIPKGQKMLKRFGGVSGSAVHVIRPGISSPRDGWLGGFVYEEGVGHTLMVTHARHINADGTIR